MSKEPCACHPVYSRFCDDAPDYKGIEYCALHGAAPDLLEAVESFLTCLPADMSIWRALGLNTSSLTMARMRGMAALTKAEKEESKDVSE